MIAGIVKEPDWGYIGALLAQTDDVKQTLFFKSFIKECNSWGTNHQVHMQLAGINHRLSKEEKETISMLGFEEDQEA